MELEGVYDVVWVWGGDSEDGRKMEAEIVSEHEEEEEKEDDQEERDD